MTRFTARLQQSALSATLMLAGLAASITSAHAGNIPVAAPEPSPIAVFGVAGTALGAILLFARLRKKALSASK